MLDNNGEKSHLSMDTVVNDEMMCIEINLFLESDMFDYIYMHVVTSDKISIKIGSIDFTCVLYALYIKV